MTARDLLRVHNGGAVPRRSVPELDVESLREGVLQAVDDGARIVALFGAEEGGVTFVYAVLADDRESQLLVGRAHLPGESYAALTPECPQAHWFERELAEQFGVVPEGHPWLKPIRFHAPWYGRRDAFGRVAETTVGITDFFRVEGEEIHEVAVGPVHAGVIEPGHFRFQCHGEHVFHLEISLGYQHRGVERALIGGPHKRTLAHMETLAGDTSVGHALAYAQAVEALAGVTPPSRAQVLRGIALELERLANHTGDLGALSGDVAYLPTASYCGRIRGDFLNLTALLCGSRLGRGLVRPGGVGFDADEATLHELGERLATAGRDLENAVELLWKTPSVVERFENTGRVTKETAESIGLVGPAARASGLDRDARHDHPHGIYQYVQLPLMTAHGGDVNSRALVRWLEAQQSIEFIGERLASMTPAPTRAAMKALRPEHLVVSLVEGWRGEIAHVAMTDGGGRFARYKVVDPSLHNWFGLALALRGEPISDFPLCNKSFNLSYCGHDL